MIILHIIPIFLYLCAESQKINNWYEQPVVQD